jgi:hypothetical protein
VVKAASVPDAPRMGSIAYNSSETGAVASPPAFGHGAAVARGTSLCCRPIPARRMRPYSFRFSAWKTRRVLATRHPFAETAQAPVRCLRL